MNGLRVSFEVNEFVASALLVTVAACAVGYLWSNRMPTAVVKESTVKVETQYIPTPPAKVTVHVVYPKPVYILPQPPEQEQEQPQSAPQPKVWDNDNLPHAYDPPTFRHETAALRQGD